MIVTGRHLPRRLFLKGLGAAIALPALDAMTPAFAAPAVAYIAAAPGVHLRAERRHPAGLDAG